MDLLRQYPALPENMPIHITGNPRGDMLRSEIRPYFAAEVERLRNLYGEFILVNTNFSDVNPYIPNVGYSCRQKATASQTVWDSLVLA